MEQGKDHIGVDLDWQYGSIVCSLTLEVAYVNNAWSVTLGTIGFKIADVAQ